MRIYPIVLAGALAACVLPAAASSTKPFPPVPTPFTTVAPPADPDHFTVAVAGDNRSAGHGTPMPQAFAEICKEIGLIHPPLVLWTGDIIEGYGDSVADANAEYDTYLAGAALTGVPVYNAPGNHEYSLNAALEPVYEKRMGSMFGSFDYGNSHFIALNTTPLEPDGTVKGGVLDDAQWRWLQDDLEANKSAANIFVFLHHYVFGPAVDDPKMDTGWLDVTDRDRFHALMVKYGVRAVLTSHAHLFWHTVKDGVEYFVSGGAGAPLDATPDMGGYLHFFLLHVDGMKISYDILQPWEIQTMSPDSDAPLDASQTVRVENSNFVDVTAAHIVLHVLPVPAGQKLAVTASTAYKKATAKPVPAQIVSTTASPDGTSVEVVVSCTLTKARTTQITVAPVTQ